MRGHNANRTSKGSAEIREARSTHKIINRQRGRERKVRVYVRRGEIGGSVAVCRGERGMGVAMSVGEG